MSEANQLNVEFARRFPEVFAERLARGETAEVAEVLDQLPPEIAAAVAARLSVRTINAMLASGVARPEVWLPAATFDDAAVLLGPLPRERCLALVNGLQNRTLRRRLLQFINYPTHSVGSLVSDTVVSIRAELPIADVLVELRALDDDLPPPVVVADANGRYVGVLNVWRLVVRDPLVGRGADYVIPVTPLRPETPLTSAVHAAQFRARDWLPVVDHEERVLGTISRQRVFDNLETAGDEVPILQDSITDVAAQMLRVLSDILGRVLAPRSTP